ncbi:hypothetical protein OIU84_008151 [Salix udensis]|uniref:Uncharacterized protein n=1 Tax=Salix udensis TaxID=889485 RepID=A0AAD6JVX2_9ROSI|nr:hypothetical protein OIU84_008151 [Salix udensis]
MARTLSNEPSQICHHHITPSLVDFLTLENVTPPLSPDDTGNVLGRWEWASTKQLEMRRAGTGVSRDELSLLGSFEGYAQKVRTIHAGTFFRYGLSKPVSEFGSSCIGDESIGASETQSKLPLRTLCCGPITKGTS